MNAVKACGIIEVQQHSRHKIEVDNELHAQAALAQG
jgi:Arc/MetJ family transcription regulator